MVGRIGVSLTVADQNNPSNTGDSDQYRVTLATCLE
jgi:hypothetical protein